MLLIGCDYHPSVQQIAMLDTETGDYSEHRLKHSDGEAEKFYRDLKLHTPKIRVGVGAEGSGARECAEIEHLSSPVFALTGLLPIQNFLTCANTGQRFRDVCFLTVKRFRRVRELFHDGFATPEDELAPKRFCNSFMMSHA